MFGLGTQELLVILVIVLILFGASRLPKLARSMGASLKEFKKGIGEEGREEGTRAAASRDGTGSVDAGPSCPKCSALVAPDARYCPHCGAVVTTGRGTPPSTSS